jgi:hypothetical protein
MTFQPPARSLTARDYIFITLVVILFLIVSIALVFENLKLPGGGEFYVHWVGSRAFTTDKIEPYSGEVAARTQQLVYGGPAQAGDEPYILDTPFEMLLLYFPFSLFSDPVLARAIYTLILELALFAAAILSLRLTEWETPRLLAVIFVIFAVFNYYSIQAVFEASPVLLLGLLYAGILYSLHMEMDELAGALMAVSFYYWEVGAPFLFLVFLRIYHEKRMRVFAGFFMVSLVLFFISFLLYPGWVIPFLRATVNNLRAGFGFNIPAIFIRLWPAYGQFLAWIFTASLIVLLGYEWSLARGGEPRRFYWASCLSLAIAPLLGFRTEMENLAVLVIPLALVFAIIHDRWRRIGNWLTFLLMLIVFGVPWTINYFFLEHLGSMAQNITFLFLPLFTVVGLYWIRWWAIRPPRILSDLANLP